MEEQDGLKNVSHLLISPMLIHNIGQNELSKNMKDGNNLDGKGVLHVHGGTTMHCFTLKLGVRKFRAVDDSLVVAKHSASLTHGHTKVMKCQT